MATANPYNEILTEPEYMCFNKKYADDKEAIQRTESTLTIINSQIVAFKSLYSFVYQAAKDNEQMTESMKQFTEASKANAEALEATAQAMAAVADMKEGKTVNLKKAMAAAEKAYAAIETQMKGGKVFVSAVDACVGGENNEGLLMLESARDMVATMCSTCASLAQDDAEMDYWSNTSRLLPEENLAHK